jgi:RimJ/RimL family protein N-acetyltransferase
MPAVTIEPVVLSGNVIRLEPLRLDHVEQLLFVGLDPELWRWTTTQIATRADLERYVQDALAEQAAGSALPFATIEAASGRAIGSTRFGNIVAQFKRCEIGWTWVTPELQRTAVNTEAKLLMLSHAFETWGFRRVEFKTSTRNEKSRNALLRLGAIQEGIFRQHMTHADGSLRDTVYFSIVREEWPAIRARLRARLDAGSSRTAQR